ncbi:MAG: hypothetical protein U0168_31185 [Nannocystaceae bacterium]
MHALGQLAAFERPVPIPVEGVRRSTACCQRMRAVTDAWEQGPAPIDPRFGNGGKHYRYRLRTVAVHAPLTARYEWQLREPLDVAAMRDAAVELVGSHDFAAFRSSACQARSTARTLFAVDVVAQDERVDVHVRGTAFLHNMVRIIAGSLVEIGLGRRTGARLAAAARRRIGVAPGPPRRPRGLLLVEVLWPGAPARLQPRPRPDQAPSRSASRRPPPRRPSRRRAPRRRSNAKPRSPTNASTPMARLSRAATMAMTKKTFMGVGLRGPP